MSAVCKYCGETIPEDEASRSLSHGTDLKFCSAKCRYSYKHFRMSKAERDSKLVRKCKFCGSEFRAKTLRSGYCSTRCQKAAAYRGWKTKTEGRTDRVERRKSVGPGGVEGVVDETREFAETMLLDPEERFAVTSKWARDKMQRYKLYYCHSYGLSMTVTSARGPQPDVEDADEGIIREVDSVSRSESRDFVPDPDNGEFE